VAVLAIMLLFNCQNNINVKCPGHDLTLPPSLFFGAIVTLT
jgi:hypothetical protein